MHRATLLRTKWAIKASGRTRSLTGLGRAATNRALGLYGLGSVSRNASKTVLEPAVAPPVEGPQRSNNTVRHRGLPNGFAEESTHTPLP